MHSDDAMDQLLRDAMSAEQPQLSPAFDARVMRRVRPRRLTSFGRAVMWVYVVVTAALAAWLIHDLPITVIVAAVVVGVPLAIGVGAYGRSLVARQ